MQQQDLVRLAARLLPGSKQACCGDATRQLAKALLLLLADGEPVALEPLADRVGRPVTAVQALLDGLPDVERDERGRVVGSGITLVPTAHRFIVDGRVLFTWCALDALSYPAVLGRTAQVESHCHATRVPVRLLVSPAGVEASEPADAAISLIPTETCSPPGSLRARFCDHVHFFRSEAAGEEWLRGHPEGVLLPVRQAFALGLRIGGLEGRSREQEARAGR